MPDILFHYLSAGDITAEDESPPQAETFFRYQNTVTLLYVSFSYFGIRISKISKGEIEVNRP